MTEKKRQQKKHTNENKNTANEYIITKKNKHMNETNI